VFTYRLVHEDGTFADPPTFVSSEPNWREGDTLMIRPGCVYRIVQQLPAEAGAHGTWVVTRAS
jgi:hypothetical protein